MEEEIQKMNRGRIRQRPTDEALDEEQVLIRARSFSSSLSIHPCSVLRPTSSSQDTACTISLLDLDIVWLSLKGEKGETATVRMEELVGKSVFRGQVNKSDNVSVEKTIKLLDSSRRIVGETKIQVTLSLKQQTSSVGTWLLNIGTCACRGEKNLEGKRVQVKLSDGSQTNEAVVKNQVATWNQVLRMRGCDPTDKPVTLILLLDDYQCYKRVGLATVASHPLDFFVNEIGAHVTVQIDVEYLGDKSVIGKEAVVSTPMTAVLECLRLRHISKKLQPGPQGTSIHLSVGSLPFSMSFPTLFAEGINTSEEEGWNLPLPFCVFSTFDPRLEVVDVAFAGSSSATALHTLASKTLLHLPEQTWSCITTESASKGSDRFVGEVQLESRFIGRDEKVAEVANSENVEWVVFLALHNYVADITKKEEKPSDLYFYAELLGMDRQSKTGSDLSVQSCVRSKVLSESIHDVLVFPAKLVSGISSRNVIIRLELRTVRHVVLKTVHIDLATFFSRKEEDHLGDGCSANRRFFHPLQFGFGQGTLLASVAVVAGNQLNEWSRHGGLATIPQIALSKDITSDATLDVRFQILAARKLRFSNNGKLTVLVQCQGGTGEAQSAITKDEPSGGRTNPTWNETVSLAIQHTGSALRLVTFTVYDDKECLGLVTLPFDLSAAGSNGAEHASWAPLVFKGKIAGEIKVQLVSNDIDVENNPSLANSLFDVNQQNIQAGDESIPLEPSASQELFAEEKEELGKTQQHPVELFVTIVRGHISSSAGVDACVKVRCGRKWLMTHTTPISKSFPTFWDRCLGPFRVQSNKATPVEVFFSVEQEDLFHAHSQTFEQCKWIVKELPEPGKVIHQVLDLPSGGFLEVSLHRDNPSQQQRRQDQDQQHDLDMLTESSDGWDKFILHTFNIVLKAEHQLVDLCQAFFRTSNGCSLLLRSLGPAMLAGVDKYMLGFVGAIPTEALQTDLSGDLILKYHLGQSANSTNKEESKEQATTMKHLLFNQSTLFVYPTEKKQVYRLSPVSDDVENTQALDIFEPEVNIIPQRNTHHTPHFLRLQIVKLADAPIQAEYSVKVFVLHSQGPSNDDFAQTRLVKGSSLVFWGENFSFSFHPNKQQHVPVAVSFHVSAYGEDGTKLLAFEKCISMDEVIRESTLESTWIEFPQALGQSSIPSSSSTTPPRLLVKVECSEAESSTALASDAVFNPAASRTVKKELVDQYERFQKAFCMYDTGNTGEIPVDLVGQLVSEQLAFLFPGSCTYNLAAEIEQLDDNGDGVVTLSEFIEWIAHKKQDMQHVSSFETPDRDAGSALKPKSDQGINSFKLVVKRAHSYVPFPSRVFLRFQDSSKFVTEAASGPLLEWNSTQSFVLDQVPRTDTMCSISIVEVKSGLRLAWKNDIKVSNLIENAEENRLEAIRLQCPPRKVFIHVIRGDNLRAADSTGFFSRISTTSDPYCKIHVAGKVKKTKVIKKSLQPVWEETLEFEMDPNQQNMDLDSEGFLPVLIEVKDHDRLSLRDTDLGSGMVLCGPQVREEYVHLSGPKAQGRILVRTHYEPFEGASIELECFQHDKDGVVTIESLESRLQARADMLEYTLLCSEASSKLLHHVRILQEAGLGAGLSPDEKDSKADEQSRSLAQTVNQIQDATVKVERRVKALENCEARARRGLTKECLDDAKALLDKVQNLIASFVQGQIDLFFSKVYYSHETSPLVLDSLLDISTTLWRVIRDLRDELDGATSGSLPLVHPDRAAFSKKNGTEVSHQSRSAEEILQDLKQSENYVRELRLRAIQKYVGVEFSTLSTKVTQNEASEEERSIFIILRPFLLATQTDVDFLHDEDGVSSTERPSKQIKALAKHVEQVRENSKVIQMLQQSHDSQMEKRKQVLNQLIQGSRDTNSLLSRFLEPDTPLSLAKPADVQYARFVVGAWKESAPVVVTKILALEIRWRRKFKEISKGFTSRCSTLIDILEECHVEGCNKLLQYVRSVFETFTTMQKEKETLTSKCDTLSSSSPSASWSDFEKLQATLNPLSPVELTVLNTFGAIENNYICAFEVLQRFVFKGATSPQVTPALVCRAVVQRVIADKRKQALEKALMERLGDLPMVNMQLKSSNLQKAFVCAPASGENISIEEAARRAAAMIVREGYLSFEEMIRLGGAITITLLDFKGALTSSFPSSSSSTLGLFQIKAIVLDAHKKTPAESLVSPRVETLRLGSTSDASMTLSIPGLESLENYKLRLEVIPSFLDRKGNLPVYSFEFDVEQFARKVGIPIKGWFTPVVTYWTQPYQGYIHVSLHSISGLEHFERPFYLRGRLIPRDTNSSMTRFFVIRCLKNGAQGGRTTHSIVFPGIDPRSQFWQGKFPGVDRTLLSFSFQVFSDASCQVPLTQETVSTLPSLKNLVESDETLSVQWEKESLMAEITLSFAADAAAVEKEKRQVAATKIGAVYRGHRCRKALIPSETISLKVEAQGLLNALGVTSTSMSTRVRVFAGGALIAASAVARRAGCSPTWQGESALELALPAFPIDDVIHVALEEAEMPEAALVSSTIASVDIPKRDFIQLVRDGVVDDERSWLPMEGGLRFKSATRVTLHVLVCKLGQHKANISEPLCTRIEFKHGRSTGNKRCTAGKTPQQQGIIEWNEAFRMVGTNATVSVHDSVQLELVGETSGTVLASFDLELLEGFARSPKPSTQWLRSKDGAISLLVRCLVQGVQNLSSASAPRVRFSLAGESGIRPSATVGTRDGGEEHSHDRTQALEEVIGAGVLQVQVVEGLDLSEFSIRPLVLGTILPWGASNEACRARTNRCWSDGKHAKWTRQDKNVLELHFPGASSQELGQVKLMLEISVAYDTILFSKAISLDSLLRKPGTEVVRWIEMENNSEKEDILNGAKLRIKMQFIPQTNGEHHDNKTQEKLSFAIVFRPRQINPTESQNASMQNRYGIEKLDDAEKVKKTFCRAMKDGDASQVRTMLESSPSLLTTRYGEQQKSALHIATQLNAIEVMQVLVQAGADTQVMDRFGKSPSEYARNVRALRILGVLAPHTTLVGRRSQIRGLEKVLQHIKGQLDAPYEEMDEATTTKKTLIDAAKDVETSEENHVQTSIDVEETEEDKSKKSSARSQGTVGSERSEGSSTWNVIVGLIRDLVHQSSAAEVFNLIDMDGDGMLDEDEFEGSMRVVLDVKDETEDPRMEVVRAMAKKICNKSKSKLCSVKDFVSFFGLQHATRRVSLKEEERSLELYISQLDYPLGCNYDSIWESDEKLRALAMNDKVVFENAMALAETVELVAFEQAMTRFVETCKKHPDTVASKFQRVMTVQFFTEAFLSMARMETQNPRTAQRVAERFGLSEGGQREGVVQHPLDKVMAVVDRGGAAPKELIERANDKLLQLVVDLVQEGHEKVDEFSSISEKLFEILDLNGDGLVDRFEFHSCMRELGVHDSSVMDQLFDLFDVDGSGQASVEEFVRHVDNYIFRKKTALHQVLESLRAERDGRLPLESSQKLAHGMQRKLMQLKRAADRTDVQGEGCFRKRMSRLESYVQVDWVVLIQSQHAVQSFREKRVVGYDKVNRILVLEDGELVRLGKDTVQSVRPLEGVAASRLLKQVQYQIHSLQALEESSAGKIQGLFRSNRAKLEARKVLEAKRQEREEARRVNNSAVMIQKHARRRFAMQTRAELVAVRKREEEIRRVHNEASVRIQARARGHIIRHQLLQKREAKRVEAVTRLQAQVRGFLIRSAESRAQKQEHQSIFSCLRNPLRKGIQAKLTVDAPRISRDLVRFNLFLNPFSSDNQSEKSTLISSPTGNKVCKATGKQVIYALESLEELPLASGGNVEKESTHPLRKQRDAVLEFLAGYGIANPDQQLGGKILGHSRGQQTFSSALMKTLEPMDEAVARETAQDLANAIIDVFPVHKDTGLEEKLFELLRPAKSNKSTLCEKDILAARGGYQKTRYLQSSRVQSFAWAQIRALSSSKLRSRTLQLKHFEGVTKDEQKDPILRCAHEPALVCSELDFYSLCVAIMGDTLKVDKVEDNKAMLSARTSQFRFHITAKISFAKTKKTSVQNPAIPSRPVCKKATIESVLIIGGINLEGEDGNPMVTNVDFWGVRVGAPVELEKASWLPPVNAKAFSERVYSLDAFFHTRDRQRDRQGGGEQQHEDGLVGDSFQRVYWIGKIRSPTGGMQRVFVDAWRIELKENGFLLRLSVEEGSLGWFSLEQCQGLIQLELRVDEGSAEWFETACGVLAPFDESPRILTGMLGHLRNRVNEMGGARRALKKYSSRDSISVEDLHQMLVSRYDMSEFLQSEIDDESESKLMLNRFVELFPAPLTLKHWESIVCVPRFDFLGWVKELLRSKEGSLVLLRAKFRLLDPVPHTGVLPHSVVVETLANFLQDEGLSKEVLERVDWSLFVDQEEDEDADLGPKPFAALMEEQKISYNRFLRAMRKDDDGLTESGPEQASQQTRRRGNETREGKYDDGGTGKQSARWREDDDDEEVEGKDRGSDGEGKVLLMSHDDLLKELIDKVHDEETWGAELMRDKMFCKALAELRFVVLQYSDPDGSGSFDVERAFRVFDQNRSGKIDVEEFKAALESLDIDRVLPSDTAIDRFVKAIDLDGDGEISYTEFVRMATVKKKLSPEMFKVKHELLTIRWEVEVYVGDIGLWMQGTASRYRPFDNAIRIELNARKDIPAQSIGFLQLDDYPILLKRNVWGGKPWGRDMLWRRIHSERSIKNSRSVLAESYTSSISASSSILSSSSSCYSSNQSDSD